MISIHPKQPCAVDRAQITIPILQMTQWKLLDAENLARSPSNMSANIKKQLHFEKIFVWKKTTSLQGSQEYGFASMRNKLFQSVQWFSIWG